MNHLKRVMIDNLYSESLKDPASSLVTPENPKKARNKINDWTNDIEKIFLILDTIDISAGGLK